MKKLELIFAAILVPLDYLALLLAGSLAYFLRFESFVAELRPVIFEMSYQQFLKILAVVSLAWLIIFALNGLYSIKRRGLIDYLSRIFVACSAATLLIVVAFFFNFHLFSSRLIILTGWLLSVIIISLERLIIHYIKKIFYKKGIGARKVAVIGSNRNAQDIINILKDNPSFGFRVIKNFSSFDENSQNELSAIYQTLGLDDVILADPNLTEKQKNDLVNFCIKCQLNYKYVASLLETKLINFNLSTIGGIPLIEVKQTRLDGWGRIIKRIFDLLVASAALIIFLPLLLIIGLFIIFTSTGPMIVKLPRIGASGKNFNCLKFRSMIKDAHQLKLKLMQQNERADGPLFKLQNDPRITKYGKFIRKWSLDEFPQLVNVIFGQMSLVGPRPHEPEEVARYQNSDKKLLVIRPGLTGLAQVSGRSDLLWEEETHLDIYYVENWSLGLDIQILLKTPRAVFGKRKAV